jgi:hypothetical protein
LEAHAEPLEYWHVDALQQGSEDRQEMELPQSHCSPASTMPLPQVVVVGSLSKHVLEDVYALIEVLEHEEN